jgi:hypothetical protein
VSATITKILFKELLMSRLLRILNFKCHLSLFKKKLKRNWIKSRLSMKVGWQKRLVNIKTYQKSQKLNLLLLSLILKLLIPCQKIYLLNPSLNPLLQNLTLNPEKTRSLPLLSTSFWLIQNVLQRRRRRNTCRSCSATKDSSHTCCTEVQNTGGK